VTHGLRIIIKYNNYIYEGNFKDNTLNVKEKLTYLERGIYEGEFKDNKLIC
jgi:hypothetical protein